MKKILFAIVAAISLATASTQAVNVISGSLWQVPEAVAQWAVPGNVPGTPPDVTFDVNSPISFFDQTWMLPRGVWLAHGGAYNVVEHTPGTLASVMDDNTTGTLLEFSGMVTVVNGEMFTVTHDDGLTLIIGGIDLGFNPGPTAPVTSWATYTGPSGTFPFELVYTECCDGPAVLQVDLPFENVPEGGATVALLGCALSLVGLIGRRIRK